jgi:hypothetical protein
MKPSTVSFLRKTVRSRLEPDREAENHTLAWRSILAIVCFLAHSVGCGQPNEALPPLAGVKLAGQPSERHVQTFDFGTIDPGSRVEREITVRNNSADRWQIAHAETSCGCLSVTVRKRDAAPGESVPLLLVADLSDEPSYEGDLNVRIRLLGASGGVVEECDAMLAVHGVSGDVTPRFRCEPSVIVAGNIEVGVPWKGQVRVKSIDTVPFIIAQGQQPLPNNVEMDVPDNEYSAEHWIILRIRPQQRGAQRAVARINIRPASGEEDIVDLPVLFHGVEASIPSRSPSPCEG